MDRPFEELHELYRIVFLKHEAQMKAEEERKKKEEEENKRQANPSSRNKKPLPKANTNEYHPSIGSDSMEEALEELIEEGGY